ncbi:MAG: glycosyltransferase family 4 protein [Flavobacteriales bacterium]|nr:glycosyltransferase family 4 protein [Flavobacteriales bacterium]
MSIQLKILQVIPTLGQGGAERLVVELSRHLQAQGHDVRIVVFRNENQYADLCSDLNIQVIPSVVTYSLTGRHVIKTVEFDRFVAEFSPDIIHSHLVEAELVSRHTILPKTNYYTHWHGCHPVADSFKLADAFSKTAWWNLLQRKRLTRQYEASKTEFICISNFISSYLQRAFPFSSHRFHTVYNGGNPNRSEVPANRNTNAVQLISLGRLAPFKNQLLLLKVVKALVDQGVTGFHLSFVGDGPSGIELKAYAKKEGLEQWITFLGHVTQPEKVLANSDILVHSTINEAFGMAIVEAMSCGMPVVAFNSGGIPEIVQNNIHGFLIEPNNLDSFTLKVKELIQNPEKRNQFSTNAVERSKAFSMHSFVKNIEALYLKKTTL